MSATPYTLDTFSSLFIVEPIHLLRPPRGWDADVLISIKPEVFHLHAVIKYPADLLLNIDISQETLNTSTVEFRYANYEGAEITNNLVNVAVILDALLPEPVTVDWAITGGTASEFLDYSSPLGSAGTISFQAGEWIKNIPIDILTNILPQPAKTIEFTLSHPVGTGSYLPMLKLNSNGVAGYSLYLFSITPFVFGASPGQIPIGITKEGTANNIATFWNINYSTTDLGSGATATALAVGNQVFFTITGGIDLDLDFSTTCPFISIFPSGSSTYHYVPSGVHAWVLSLGINVQTMLLIDSHAAHPGIVSVISYNPGSRRAALRTQIPTTTVIQLQETLDDYSVRLANKGF